MDIFAIIGQRLREIRKSKSMSLDDVASISGVNCNYIGQIERAVKNPTLVTLKKITDALNITLTEIISYAENATIYTRSKKLNEIVLMLEDSKDNELDRIKTLLQYVMEIKNVDNSNSSDIELLNLTNKKRVDESRNGNK